MNLNKEFLSEVIKYLISKGVTVHDVLDTFNEHFNTLDAFNDSLKNIPTEIKRGTINNVIEEPVLPKYTLTESDKISLESVSLSPETLNKVFDTSKCEVRKPITDIDLLLCGRELEKQGFNVEPESKETPAPLKVSLSPNTRNYPTSVTPRGRGVSKARKMLFEVVEGKTVLEHLKANNINYKLFDTRIRKNWTMEKACTTPMTRVIRPYTKSKKPEETLETETKSIETQSNTEKPTKTVTNESELKGNNVTAVILDTPNPDAIREDKNDIIEKALKKFVTHSEESKKDKKPKEVKADLTVLEVCQKMNVTIHELKEMVSAGEFPQPDCDKKWSVKLLKKEGVI